MTAYVIVEMEITDPVAIQEYRRLAAESIAAHGGRYIVRGGNVDHLEGGWTPERIVVLEFADAARARAWWASPEYAQARAARADAARARMIVVEGVA